MKVTSKLLIFLALALLLALPVSALAAEPNLDIQSVRPDEFVFGGNFVLRSGETLRGNLWVFGGNADLQQDSLVTGSVMVAGGNLRINGRVDGDINAAGGNIELLENALVRGDVNMLGGTVSQRQGARVEGRIQENGRGPVQIVPPTFRTPTFPAFNVRMTPVWDFLSFLFQSFFVAALAVVAALFLPQPMERVSRAAVAQPLLASGLGLLTIIVVPILMVIMAITLILIPVSLLAGLALGLFILFGWIAVGLEVGKRMAVLFKTTWALPVAAGLGTLVLALVAGGAGRYIICVGWILPAFVAVLGLGSVLLTRFGTQIYPTELPPGYAPPPYPEVPRGPVSPTPPPPGAGPRPMYDEEIPSPGGEPYQPPSSGQVGVYPAPEDRPPDPDQEPQI
jgi:cytoskeletal protein CcmA (bactofilin family)